MPDRRTLAPCPWPRPAAWVCLVAAVLLLPSALGAQSLRGSRASMSRQFRVARQHDFTFLRTSSQVQRFVRAGYLVPVRSGRDFVLAGVSFPYARPEVRTFVRRLASQYRRACGERLVVTSLTRPRSRQPRNASSLSVHPTGMAVDIRRSNNRVCRAWIERVLLQLERTGVLEATRERRPPHYHVAVYPRPYARYVATLVARQGGSGEVVDYQVRRGDSLWEIARAYRTSVEELRRANRLASSRIYPGQLLRIPAGR